MVLNYCSSKFVQVRTHFSSRVLSLVQHGRSAQASLALAFAIKIKRLVPNAGWESNGTVWIPVIRPYSISSEASIDLILGVLPHQARFSQGYLPIYSARIKPCFSLPSFSRGGIVRRAQVNTSSTSPRLPRYSLIEAKTPRQCLATSRPLAIL